MYILKKYTFSEYRNEKFSHEDIVWNKTALDGLKLKRYSAVITIYEYLEEGLINQIRKI